MQSCKEYLAIERYGCPKSGQPYILTINTKKHKTAIISKSSAI